MSYRLLAVALMGTLLGGLTVLGDTIILNNGQEIVGLVTPTDTGYIVVTHSRQHRYSKEAVKEWIRDGLTEDDLPLPTPAPVSTTTTSPQPTTVPPAPAPASSAADKRAVETLLRNGQDAIKAGEFIAARDAFMDAISLDPRNPKCLHGLGLVYLNLANYSRAVEILEQGCAVSPVPMDRALALNLASAELLRKNPMRAVKVLMLSLSQRSKELDEPMLNLLGTALAAAPASSRNGSLFTSSVNFYMSYNERLEKAVPGMKRFGPKWYPVAKAEEKLEQLTELERTTARLLNRLGQVEKDLEIAKIDVGRAQSLYNQGFIEREDLDLARRQAERMENKHNSLRAEYENALSGEGRPEWPEKPTLALLSDSTPPRPGPPPPPPVPVKPKPVIVAIAKPVNRSVTDHPPEPKPTSRRPRPPEARPADPKPVVAKPAAPEPPIEQPEPQKIRVTQYAAAFPVAPDLVVTAAAPLERATEMQVQSANGVLLTSQLVRIDKNSGLALLRITNRRLDHLDIAEKFNGGVVQCAAFASASIFSPTAELILGTAPQPCDGWKVSLERHPRLAGSPLTARGQVVGVVTASRDAGMKELTAVPIEAIRRLMGNDRPSQPGSGANPTSLLLQVMTVREVVR